MTSLSEDQGSYNSKIKRVSSKYGLEDIDQELADRWTRTDDRFSLRELADFFNEQVLRAAVESQNMNPLEGEVENFYRILTDDVSSGVKMQARKRLEQNGVDVDELVHDFVSYQSINRHLKNDLGVTQSTTKSGSDPKRKQQRLYALQNRVVAVVENTLEQLQGTGELALPDFDVVVDIRITCSHCNRIHSLRELFDQKGCECQLESDT
ncbi:hypothetical protein OB955_21675 [Halobacteria archaeon AArc-m2/3/4]|uniref:Uncharacterized protein n=1 Tax=Natronoglomus mannanivorans TaxID=2979990 RepID=A0ABT2QKC7_9EURY|nr:hypothetical protein [Halobacteria archaeon AArc-m2/3/4]